MKSIEYVIFTLFIIAILIAPSIAATRTITYTHTIPSNITDWNHDHILPLFDPALGKLLRVNYNETLNATMSGIAENLGNSIARAYLTDDTETYAYLLDGSSIYLAASLRYPSVGYKNMPIFDGLKDWAGSDSFNITMVELKSSDVTYTLPADLARYIATTPGETASFPVTAVGVSGHSGSGNFQTLIETWAGAEARITYTYNDSRCLSGYKIDNCTNIGLSGWTINVTNNTQKWSTETDGNGFWQICGLDNDTYTICETPQSGWVHISPVSGCCIKTIDGANITNINFTNQKTYCISGYKLDNCTKAGIKDWIITLNNSSGYIVSTATGADGFYQFCGLVPGSYTLKEETRSGWMNKGPVTLSVTLPCSSNLTNQNFTNQKLMCIEGRKTNKCGGAGLPGWVITLNNSSGIVDRTSTNATGYYRFCNLSPGNYIVYETMKPGWMPAGDPRHYVTLDCDNVTGVKFVNTPLLCIEGRKTNSCNGTGLPGWVITLNNSSGIVNRTSTNATGYYQFCGLAPDLYQVCETMQPGWIPVGDTCHDVNLVCNNATGADFVNTPLLCINGTKVNDCNEAGLDGWTMILKNSTGSEVDRTTTGNGGKWSFCDLLPDNYYVEEVLKNGWHNVTELNQSVELECDDETGIEFRNEPLLCINGTKVNDCNEAGLEGWTMILKNSTGSELDRTTTGNGGKWSFCDLLPDNYYVEEVLKNGWHNVTELNQSVELECDDETGIEFRNEPLLCINGTKVNDCNEAGLDGWTMILKNSTGSELDRTTTGNGGKWSFCDLLPDNYYVEEVLKNGWHNVTELNQSVELECDDETGIEFRNEPLLCINGTKVNDCNEAGLDGWTMILKNSTGSELDRTTTGNGGKWSFCDLLPDNYYVEEVLKNGWHNVTELNQSVELECDDETGIEFRNEPLLCINGTKVNDCNEAGLDGWTMILKNSTGSELDRTTTGNGGKWSFCDLLPDNYYVEEVLKNGWHNVTELNQSVELECDDETGIEFRNEPLLCINGTKVNDCNEAGLDGWTMILKNSTGSELDRTTTGNGGKWSFCDLLPDNYYVEEVLKNGWHNVTELNQSVELECDDETGIEFRNEPLLCINGTKVNDCNEAGLEGWTMILKNSTGSELDRTTTANGGKWSFCDLLPDNYYVEEVLKNGWHNVTELNQSVELECDDETGIEFRNEPLLCINGTKVNDCNEAGLEGWTMILKNSTGSELDRTTTGNGGKWSFCDLLPDNYYVEEVLKNGWHNVTELNQSVELECDDETGIEFRNEPLLCINGTKVNDCNEAGLEGWTMILKNSTGSELDRTTTGNGGKWSFCDLLPDNYYVEEVLKNGWHNVTELNQSVELECDDETGIEFRNEPLLCINGTKVNDCNEAGLDGWTMILKNSTGSELDRTTTGNGGKWSFCDLLPDNYYVEEVLKNGWHNVTELNQSVELECDDETGIEFRNEPLLCINGTKVNDCNEAGLDGWTMILKNSTGSELDRTTTGNGGKWSFCDLLPDNYYVEEVLKNGWHNVTELNQSVELECDDETGIEFRNEPLLCINGTKVNDCNEAGLDGWTMILKNSTGSEVDRTTTANGGKWSFCDLLPDNYYVEEVLQSGWHNITALNRSVSLGCINANGIEFRNAPLLCISGSKVNDCNGQGLDGWTMILKDSKGNELARNTTTGGGHWSFCSLLSGNYYVEEVLQSSWHNVTALNQSVSLGCSNAQGVEFRNAPLLCISGSKVNDCNGQGLDGWTMILKDSKGNELARNTTIGGGKWSFCSLLSGNYYVEEVLQSGWHNITALNQSVSLGCSNALGAEFRNFPLRCLSGYKHNERGDGLSGWTIEARNSTTGSLVGSALTDSSGYWEICQLMPGDYEVSEVMQANYKPVTPAKVTVPLSECSNHSNINFTNTLPACIEGFKMDEKGQGLSGWTIEARNSSGIVVGSALTKPNGFWQICGLENGTYTVCEVLKPDWMQLSPPDCYTEIVSGVNISDLNFTNTLTQCISGRKVDSITGQGLAGWTITATNNQGRQFSNVTNATGYWQICGLQKDNYTVCEVLKSGWTRVFPNTPDGCYHINVDGQTDFTNLDFHNDPHSLCISGHKFQNTTNDGLEGWTIAVTNATDRLTAITNDTGYWKVCGLAAGEYTVCEVPQAGWKAVGPICQNVTLVNSNKYDVDFYNEPTELLCLSGHKYQNSTGEGLPGWTIQVTNASGTLTTVTDATGYWKICGLTNGDYTVCEVPQQDWVQAWPPQGCYKVTLKGSSNNSLDFMNDKVVFKVADKTVVQRGEDITYTITVCNPTFESWRNVNITDIFSYSVEILYPVQTMGTRVSWVVNEIPAGSCMQFKVIARVPKIDSKFNMEQSVSGEGFVNVHNDYSTSFEGSALRNCVYVQVDKLTFSDCAVVGVRELGTQMMTKEHGSGQYETEHELKYDSKNFSIEDKENVSAVYEPTTFILPANRSIDYNTLWIKKYKAKNFITGASMNEEYTFATKINRDGGMKVDKNESIMDINSSFVGQAHLGFLKKAQPGSPAKATPIFEMQEDYNGAFGMQEKVSEYGKNVQSNKSATGVGYVAVDKRIRDTQRTYESGTGSYQVEEKIETPTSYIYKDLKVGSRPSTFSFTPRVKTSQDLLWSEGMVSKSSDTTLRGGSLFKGNDSCLMAKTSSNTSCTSGGSRDNRTVSYISERYSGIENLNKTTEARGLNEMSTQATFQGTADYRTLMTGPNKTAEVDNEERYVGSYDISRHILMTGVSKYDVPHMTVSKDGTTVNRWYNGTNATIALYTIHITNDGNRALAPIQVMDRFPPGTEYVYSSLKPSSLGKTQANWTLTHLGIGDNMDIELELNVTDVGFSGELAGDLVNRVDVYGSYSSGWVNAASYHVMPVNWLGCCSPELGLKKTATIESSDQTLIDYRIVLQNLANYPMAVTVVDYLPDSLRIVESNQTPAKYVPGRAEWVFNTVPAGGAVTVDYVARALRDGRQINKVKVRGVAITGEGSASAEAEASVDVKGTGSQPYTVRYDGWQPPNWDLNTTEEGWYTGDIGVAAEDEI